MGKANAPKTRAVRAKKPSAPASNARAPKAKASTARAKAPKASAPKASAKAKAPRTRPKTTSAAKPKTIAARAKAPRTKAATSAAKANARKAKAGKARAGKTSAATTEAAPADAPRPGTSSGPRPRAATTRAAPDRGARSHAPLPMRAHPPARGVRVLRTGLRALVPSTYRAEGETDAFLKSYKEKWLSRLDFNSAENVHSLLMLGFLVLALGREGEAEAIATRIIQHVDVVNAGVEMRNTVASAHRLAAWLKAKRGVNAQPLLARAAVLGTLSAHQDRTWLSNEAAAEIDDAVARHKMSYLAYPLAGIVRWINAPAARHKAEALLDTALEALRSMMR